MEYILERLRTARFSFVTEWVLAWTLIAGFSIRYCIDYILMRRQMAVVRRNPERWCHTIPITTLPQTKKQNEAVQTQQQILAELVDMFSRERNESKTDFLTLFPDEEVLKVLQSNTRARQLASLLMLSVPLSMDHEPSALSYCNSQDTMEIGTIPMK
jgi:hypothetical protein